MGQRGCQRHWLDYDAFRIASPPLGKAHWEAHFHFHLCVSHLEMSLSPPCCVRLFSGMVPGWTLEPQLPSSLSTTMDRARGIWSGNKASERSVQGRWSHAELWESQGVAGWRGPCPCGSVKSGGPR